MDAESYHSVYDSPRMARAYAFDRPPVHAPIVRAIRERLGLHAPVARALDIGCGAGLSTAALTELADHVAGLEPVPGMLGYCHDVAAGATFVAGRAERLPFAAGVIDLVTAAGALNYVDLDAFFPQLVRVLAPGGRLVIYDFSEGSRLRDDPRLGAWYATFAARYPPRPGYEMDVTAIDYGRFGLRLDTYEEFDVAAPMTLTTYLAYVMSETGVEMALARGVAEDEIRAWCAATLAGVFGAGTRDVLFEAYIACVTRGNPGSARPERGRREAPGYPNKIL
jgi:SAM-dependent methyltransferase